MKVSKSVSRVKEVGIFGNWTVLKADNYQYVICKCSCGTIKRVRADSLEAGDSTSCGCQVSPYMKILGVKCTDHPLYQTYKDMLRRCQDPNRRDYKYYGGRGISVTSRWKYCEEGGVDRGFLNFLEDMEEGYSRGKELERLDVNGDYCKENCTWVCRRSQANNKSNNRELYLGKIRLSVSEWACVLGVSRKVLSDRVNKLGWGEDLTKYFDKPVKKRGTKLSYKGEVVTITEVFKREGISYGRKNYLTNKYGGGYEALLGIGVEVVKIEPSETKLLDFNSALTKLRDKKRTSFEQRVLEKIEEQLD